jgi:glycosyltransferase involved in cell wall biosynthesis
MLENLPNIVLEAMACGTPCVAFKQGGVPDLIDHKECGYLAQSYDTGDLARGISWVLEDQRRHSELARRARQKVAADFNLNYVAARYRALYQELLLSQESK